MTVTEAELEECVVELAGKHGVPGAVVGVLDDSRVLVAATGAAHVELDEPMRARTPFLIGSITKTWMASLTLRAVERGLVALDDPVRRHLPELATAEPDAVEQLTVRHLLTHQSGLDAADMLVEDDVAGTIAAYVAKLRQVGSLFRPGEFASYCNPGYVIAGRLLEVVFGQPFDDVLRDEMIRPLGLSSTSTSLDEAVRERPAIGSYPADGRHVSTPRFRMAANWAPAGTTLVSSAADVLAVAQIQLGLGRAANGTRLLSTESAQQMQTHQVDLPVKSLGSYGLAWSRQEHDGHLVLTHGGASLGGRSHVVLYPDRNQAHVAFTNTIAGADFHTAVVDALGELLGVPDAATDPDPDPGAAAPADEYVGVYQRFGYRTDIRADGDGLTVTTTVTDPALAAFEGRTESGYRAVPSGPSSFSSPAIATGAVTTGRGFVVRHDDGRRYLYVGGRLSARIGD